MIWRMNCLRDSQDILLICVLIINLLQSFPLLVVCPFRLDCALLLISWCEICELSLAPGTFIVYSYKYQHDDGRVSYPLCFIFSSPVGKKHLLWMYGTHCSLHCLVMKVVNAGICLCLAGCRPEQMMMYAGSKNKLVHTVQLSKVSERLLTKTPIYNKTLVLTEISGHRFKKKSLNHTLLFMFLPGVWDQKHRGPDRGMAQRETSALRLKSSHPVVWDARRIQIAQLVSSLGKNTPQSMFPSSLHQTWFK